MYPAEPLQYVPELQPKLIQHVSPALPQAPQTPLKLHLPDWHSEPAVQAVPSGASVWQELPLQPYEHDVVVWVGQVPLLQYAVLYCVLPLQVWAEHTVLPLLLPDLTQTERPVEHDVVPVSQTLGVLQLWLGVHAPHEPPWQYMFVPHDWPLVPAFIAQVPPAPEQSWQAGHDGLPQHLLLTQLPLEQSAPAEQVAPLASSCVPHVPPAVQLPVTQSALEAQLALHDVASAQTREPPQAWGVPAKHAPAPSQVLIVRLDPEQVEPHGVLAAG